MLKKVQAYRNTSIDWKPSPVVALATSIDDLQVAAAREDGSLEIWLVSPGSVGWHCQLTIHGDPNSRVSSLVWCCSGSKAMPSGRLFSSSIDGSVSEWDLFDLKQKIVLDSIGVSIWQMAVAPSSNPQLHADLDSQNNIANGHMNGDVDNSDDYETSESEDDSDSAGLHEASVVEHPRIAIGCDDGCVRLYSITGSDGLTYIKSLPRVSGRVLSVTWSPDANLIYSGSSDGFIRCWNAKLGQEIYRITVGLGGSGSGSELCIWSLLALRSGTLVSADSSGSVQFWDCEHGTLLQSHSCHKGDVNALAAVPGHNTVFSAGSDGQVILYKLSSDKVGSSGDIVRKKWACVNYVRAHTHDVRALTVAVPIIREDILRDEKGKKDRANRRWKKPMDFSYHKWAHLGVPMLVSAGDDTKLFAYSANEFSKFSPHDICPAPQRVPIQLVLNSDFNQTLLLVQASYWLDILCLRSKNGVVPDMGSRLSGGFAATDLLVRVKSKASQKIICSTISTSGAFFAYSDHVKLSLFKLTRCEGGKSAWAVDKRKLPRKLPYALSMVFSFDSSQLMITGHDRRIYVVDVESSQLVHIFTPCREEHAEEFPPCEPPITKMFTSSDGQWLAAINCFGDAYIFNLELQRQHWFISRLDGASVTAGGFPPNNSNVLILTTSLNQFYAFDVEAKQLGEWSTWHTFVLPRSFQEFPGEVIGLSFPPSNSASVIVYSTRAMCFIDFGIPLDHDKLTLTKCLDSAMKLQITPPINGERLKRKFENFKKETIVNNFEFQDFKNPVLFIGHLSKKSVLVMEKPWMEVVKGFDAPPVHRHIFGT